MSKKNKKEKTLLNEAVTRRFMGLAGIGTFADDYLKKVNENYLSEMPEEEDDEIEMRDEPAPPMDMGDEPPMPEEEPEMDDGMGAGGDEALVQDIVSAIADALEQTTGVAVDVEGPAGDALGGAEDTGGDSDVDDVDMDMGSEPDMGDELGMDDEEDEMLGEQADHKLSAAKEEDPTTVDTEKNGPKPDPAGRSEGGKGGHSGSESFNAGRGKLKPLALQEEESLEEENLDEVEELEETDEARDKMVAEIARRVADRLLQERKRSLSRKGQKGRTPRKKSVRRK